MKSPPWFDGLPPPRSYRSIFKWGAAGEFKHPPQRLLALFMERLEMCEEDFKERRETGEGEVMKELPCRLPGQVIAKLGGIVGTSNVRTGVYERVAAAYGKTMLDLMRLRKGIVENVPDVVVSPRSADEVEAVVKLCSQERIPLVPVGGGTTVTRGVECPRGGVSLDMRTHMNRILSFSHINQTVTVEPGILGPVLEKALNEAPERFGAPRRYTCGHFPQSFEFSTVGGWIATKGAGQASTYYGKVEQMVISQRYVTPVGVIETATAPADAMGPDIDQIMVGSEGAFGVLVAVTLKVFRYMPSNRRRFSFMFRDWESAVEAAREIVHSEAGMPSVLRLSDPEETDAALKLYGIDRNPIIEGVLRLRGYRAGERCLMLGCADGEAGYTRNVEAYARRVASSLGALNTTGIVVRAWEHGRYREPYMRDDLQDFGIVTDTLECATTWEGLHRVRTAVRSFCQKRPRTMCLTHCSHFYPQGANLYFIFITRMTEIEEYLSFQEGVLDAIVRSGAVLSHHHGIGKMLAPWLEWSIGSNELAVLRALKRHFDPHGIMNPGGTLALDLPSSEKRLGGRGKLSALDQR